MKRILIADDHPLTLLGTKSYVESLGYKVVATCTNGITALNSLIDTKPDIAILDISMPGMSGLEVARKIQLQKLPIKIVLLTMHNERTLYLKAQEYGIDGYLLKEHTQTELQDCLTVIKTGQKYSSVFLTNNLVTSTSTETESELAKLTPAERKIIELIARQQTSKQIAEMLFISMRTVEKHRGNIIVKLGLSKEKNSVLIWALKNL